MTDTSRSSRWRRAAIVALCALAVAVIAPRAAAQTALGDTVRVRSGNHPSFARLVLVYSDARRWSVVPTDAGYRIDLADTAGFDVTGVFDLIPRDRIGALVPEPGGRLVLDVACECHVDVLELPGRGLVVDVRDGPAPPGNPFELLRPDPSQAPADVPAAERQLPSPGLRTAATPQLTFGLGASRSVVPGISPDPALRAADPQAADGPAISPRTRSTAAAVAALLPEVDPADAEPRATDRPEADRALAASPPVNQQAAVAVVELPDPPVPLVLPPPSDAMPATVPGTTADQAAAPVASPDVSGDADSPAMPREATIADAGRVPSPAAVRPLAPTDAAAEAAPPTLAADDGVMPLPDVVAGDGADRPGARPGRWVTVPPDVVPEMPDALPDDGAPSASRALASLPVLPPRIVPGDIAALLPLRVAPASPPPSAEDAAAASAFADMLARQVGRGIAQGVVDAAVSAGATTGQAAPEVTLPPGSEPRPATQAALPGTQASPLDPLSQIEIATALDRARARERRLDLPAEAQAACHDEALFDTAAWVDEAGTLPDFASRRAAVVGEFDRVNPEALEAAVRYHVAFGFGAEARQLLAAFGSPSPLPPDRIEVLRAMSHIVDGQAGAATEALADQLACRSRAAIWGALASPNLPPDADYSSTAILSAFEELPTELRRSLGPELANRFLQIGDMDTVAALRRSVGRIDLPDDAASDLAREPGTLLDARVEAAEGRATQSEAHLADVARLDGPLAPEALAELIESRLDRGELPDDAVVATAAALAMERRGSAEGKRLRRAEILSHVARDDFDRAHAELRRAAAGSEIDAQAVADIADSYVSAMTDRASDRVFLARLPQQSAELLDLGLSPDTRRAAAERLVALGLPEAALPMVDTLGSDVAARQVASRAWLRLDQPGTALARVAGLTGDEAERLRAEAYVALGDPGTASRVLDGLGDGQAAVAAAWRAGDLARVSRDPEAPRARMADLAQSDDPRAPDSLAPLAEHRDLIADIARRREMIAAELARP